MIVLTEHKRFVAKWIAGCDDVTAEIEHLLDKAYPEGAEARFYYDWGDEIKLSEQSDKENMEEALSVMDAWRDSGMSPGDFLSHQE